MSNIIAEIEKIKDSKNPDYVLLFTADARDSNNVIQPGPMVPMLKTSVKKLAVKVGDKISISID